MVLNVGQIYNKKGVGVGVGVCEAGGGGGRGWGWRRGLPPFD